MKTAFPYPLAHAVLHGVFRLGDGLLLFVKWWIAVDVALCIALVPICIVLRLHYLFQAQRRPTLLKDVISPAVRQDPVRQNNLARAQ